MSDKKNVQNKIDNMEKAEKPTAKTLENTDKKPLSDEVKQRIAGLAVIGVITVGLCITGMVGKFSGDSIPTASVSSSVSESSAADDVNSAADSSSVNSVEESSKEDESSDTGESSQPDESADVTAADESSQQETSDSQSDETSADSEQSKTDDTSKSESSQPDKPQTAKPSKTDPPKTDPPKTDPPKTDPPKTDPPAPSGGLSANCSVTNSWEEDGKKCFQISITINNGTSSEKNGWTVSMTVPSGTEIMNSWNGNFSINGTTITITNLDYNGRIAAGGHSADIGLIVKSPSEFTPSASVK